MKKLLLALVVCGALAGCTSIDYKPFVGNDQVYQGNGGALEQDDGIDIWSNGEPNRPFKILGYMTAEIRDGFFAEELMMSSVISKAKDVGADAIILTGSNTIGAGTYSVGTGASTTGFFGGSARSFGTGAGTAIALRDLQHAYVLIKYVDK